MHFGAKGDGASNDTSALRGALTAAGKAGGGIVLLPAPHTFLSGSLHMQSHTIFRVEAGATLLGSTIYSDYPHEWIPGGRGPDSRQRQSLIAGVQCTAPRADGKGCQRWDPLQNVTLDGGGTIDGQGHAWWWAKDAGSPAASERMDMIQPALVNGAPPSWQIARDSLPVECSYS